jgi:hypothetical protein
MLKLDPASTMFARDGKFISPSAAEFIFKARTNQCPVRGICGKPVPDKRCRRCGAEKETLAHVLTLCPPSMVTNITARHEMVVDFTIADLSGTEFAEHIKVDRVCQEAGRTLRPDIVAINENTKRALILDATSPYEADQNTFAASRKMKEEDALKKRGFDVINTAIICGALGAYDTKNDVVLRAAGAKAKAHSKCHRGLEVHAPAA